MPHFKVLEVGTQTSNPGLVLSLPLVRPAMRCDDMSCLLAQYHTIDAHRRAASVVVVVVVVVVVGGGGAVVVVTITTTTTTMTATTTEWPQRRTSAF